MTTAPEPYQHSAAEARAMEPEVYEEIAAALTVRGTRATAVSVEGDVHEVQVAANDTHYRLIGAWAAPDFSGFPQDWYLTHATGSEPYTHPDGRIETLFDWDEDHQQALGVGLGAPVEAIVDQTMALLTRGQAQP